MKTAIKISLIIVLVSCGKKDGNETTYVSKDFAENPKLEKITSSGNLLLGEWMMQLSCDGTIVCNVCPLVSFKENGAGATTIGGIWLLDNFKWEIKEDKIKITKTSECPIDTGEYAFSHEKKGNAVGLKLVEVTSGSCYQLYATRDDLAR